MARYTMINRRYRERQYCKALIQEFDLTYPEIKNLLYHIPNGEKRDAKTGALLKAMGVRAGIPDYFLAVARDGYHGMYIEMKADEKQKPTDNQQARMTELSAHGYLCITCASNAEAMNKITKYLRQAS